jgi:hypothetical protein
MCWLAVKDNQPQLAEALRDFFSSLNAPETRFGHYRRAVSRDLWRGRQPGGVI